VSQEEEFLQLSSCQLVALIRRDQLNVREERDVYNAVLRVLSKPKSPFFSFLNKEFFSIFSGFEVMKNTDDQRWRVF